MKEKLLPIYALRMLLLEKLNPHFFKENAAFILRTSLAAQDYVLSGNYYEYDKDRMGHLFRTLPGYIHVHQKYKIPYNPKASLLTPYEVNPGLVMDLAWSLKTDILNGIVDQKGNIKDTKSLIGSEVLHVYHNSQLSGIPVNALGFLPTSQIQRMIALAGQRTK